MGDARYGHPDVDAFGGDDFRDIDYDEISEKLDEADARCESIDEYLDRVDQDRLEWDRVEHDLFPAEDPHLDELRPPKVHRDTDQIQEWMRVERRKRATENVLDD